MYAKRRMCIGTYLELLSVIFFRDSKKITAPNYDYNKGRKRRKKRGVR